MEQFKFVPKPGLKIRDPNTYRFVDPAGEMKPRDGFWTRRLNDGDGTEGRLDNEDPEDPNILQNGPMVANSNATSKAKLRVAK